MMKFRFTALDWYGDPIDQDIRICHAETAAGVHRFIGKNVAELLIQKNACEAVTVKRVRKNP